MWQRALAGGDGENDFYLPALKSPLKLFSPDPKKYNSNKDPYVKDA